MRDDRRGGRRGVEQNGHERVIDVPADQRAIGWKPVGDAFQQGALAFAGRNHVRA